MLTLFRRLRLYQKLGISFLSFALPLSVLGYFMDLSFVYDLNIAKTELSGNTYQKRLSDLLYLLPRYQMLQLGLEAPGLGSSGDIAVLKEQIDALVEDLQTQAKLLSPDLSFVPQSEDSKNNLLRSLDNLKQIWRRDKELSPGSSLSHELLDTAFGLFRQLSEVSLLRVDPALDSNNLMEATLWGVPGFIHRQLLLADSLAPFFRHAPPDIPRDLTGMQRAKLQEGLFMLESMSENHIEQAIRIALREDANFYGRVDKLHEQLHDILESFSANAQAFEEQLVQLALGSSPVAPEALAHGFVDSWRGACEIHELAVQGLGSMLQQRIASYQRWRLLGASASLGALLLSLSLVLLMGRDIIRSVSNLMRYTHDVRGGDYDAVLPEIPGRDIHALAEDIQAMVTELKHRLAFSQGILESIVAPFLVVNVDKRVTFVNLAMLQLLEEECSPADCLNNDVLDFYKHHPQVKALLEQCVVQRVCVENQEIVLTGRKGRDAVISLTLSPLYDLDETLIGACFFVFDLTELKRNQQEILDKNIEIERLAAFPRENPSPVLSADAQGAITYSNPATTDVLERLNVDMQTLLPANHSQLMALCLTGEYGRIQVEHTVAGQIYEFAYSPLGAQNSVQIYAADVTERKRMEEQLLHDALHDSLTGLPNRALFLDRLSQALARGKRDHTGFFAVMLVDIDNFKFINDSLGHSTGDVFLQTLARRMASTLGKFDTIARLGGDEFIILLDSIATISDALAAADKIQAVLRQPTSILDYELSATASIGIVVDNGIYDEPENLLRDADTAMFRAKALGRARSEVFDEAMHHSARNRLSLEMDLKRALERSELEAYYQPMVCLRTGRLGGFEALMRWNHPERGLLSPNDFIPLAEETGLIAPMGLNILHEACRQAQAWRGQYPDHEDLIMSVNLSVRQFRTASLVDDVREVLEITRFPGTNLKLEVTESGIMEDRDISLKQMHGLRELGVRLSIDDFGTGYSSLSYLPRFPFDFIKVDRSFVMHLEAGDDNRTVVKTIVSLAHDMDKEIIAEGIETQAQLDILREFSCEFGQGFLFSRPEPRDVAGLMLEQGHSW